MNFSRENFPRRLMDLTTAVVVLTCLAVVQVPAATKVHAVGTSPKYWWSTPVDMSLSSDNSNNLDLKMSDDGTKVVAGWTQQTSTTASDVKLRVGTITSTGVTWGTAEDVDISSNGSSNRYLQFALSADGTKVTAVWVNYEVSGARNGKQSIRTTSLAISGNAINAGSITTLSDASSGTADNAKYPSIAMSSDGTKVSVAWYNSNNGGQWLIKSRAATVSGTSQTWGSTSTLTTSVSGENDDLVNIALSSDGTKATALWWRDTGSSRLVRSASATISGTTQTWGSVSDVTSPSGSSGGRIYRYASLSLSSDGAQAIAIWKFGSGGTGWAIQSKIGTVSGTTQSWGSSTTLSTNDADSPSVKLSADGTKATAIWSEANANYQYLAHSKSATISGTTATWGADTTLSEAGAGAIEPVLDLSKDGSRAVALWRRNDGTNTRTQITGSSIAGSVATWESSGNISPAGGSVAMNPAVAIAGIAGNTSAIWMRDNGTFNVSQAAVSVTPSSDADLSTLVSSGGSLSPTFAASTATYSESVANSVTSYTVTPTVNDANSTVTVNGVPVLSGATSLSLPLNVGSNTVTVVVTAQDGTVKTYTIMVTRVAATSSNNQSSGTPSSNTSSGSGGSTSSSPTSSGSDSTTQATPTLVNGKSPQLSSGAGQIVMDDGSVKPVPVSVVNKDIRIGTSTFNMVLDTSGQRTVYEGSNIVIDADKQALVSGHGFLPNSIVEVWVFSTPTFLGTAQVDAKGEFSKYFTIPESLPSGKHTLQAEGLNTENKPRAVSAGIVLRRGAASLTTLPKTGQNGLLVLWLGLLMLCVGLLVSRRSLVASNNLKCD